MWKKLGNIFNEHHAQHPVVDVYVDFFRIYYSTRIDGKSRPMFIDVDKNNPTKVIRKCEKPILELGDRGSFDWAGIMPTDIVTIDGVKHLYYIGWSLRQDIPYHNSLGLALSYDNGKNWTKYSKGPILSTSHLEPGYVGTIDVIKDEKDYKGYYLSCRNWSEYENNIEPIYDLKLATSTNGKDWLPTNKICIPLQEDEGGISSASVIKIKDIYYMWFSVRKKFNYRNNIDNSYRIKMATSFNGLDWNRINSNEIDISDNDWENFMVCYPEIVSHNDNLLMFYNGNGFGKSGIGLASKKINNFYE